MPFESGHNKVGGRTKGQENKLTTEARKLFLQTLEKQVPDIDKAFDDVKKKDSAKYLELFAKYAQYFVPKQVEATITDNTIKVKTGDETDE